MAAGHTPSPRQVRPGANPVSARRLPGAITLGRLAARTAPAGTRKIADVARTGSLEEICSAKRTLVVTFRRDGTPVPTPVWAAHANGVLYVRSERASGKLKRLRNDARVLLAPCTSRGKPLGAPIEGHAFLVALEQEQLAELVLAGRYGFGRECFERTMDVMRIDMCYLRLEPGAWSEARLLGGSAERLAP